MSDDNRVGRPLAPFDLKEGWQDEILNLYKTGASDVEVKSLIWYQRGSFSNDLWDRWIKDEDQFSETVKVGKMLSEAWWTSQGRLNLKMKDFNFVGWYMNMKNRFGWKDKSETDVNLHGSLNWIEQKTYQSPDGALENKSL